MILPVFWSFRGRKKCRDFEHPVHAPSRRSLGRGYKTRPLSQTKFLRCNGVPKVCLTKTRQTRLKTAVRVSKQINAATSRAASERSIIIVVKRSPITKITRTYYTIHNINLNIRKQGRCYDLYGLRFLNHNAL